MQRVAVMAAVAAGLLCSAASRARADDAADVKKLVQAEIKAALDKKKDDDTKDMVMRVRWNNGPYLETADKQFTFRITAKMHLDTVFTDAARSLQGPAPGVGDDFDSATYLRRARLGIAGDLTPYVDYRLILDFSDPTDPTFKDAYITLKNLKPCLGCWVPDIRLGQQYEAVGLENMTADQNTTFVERAVTTNLHPERSIGLNLVDSFWKDRATSQLGVFSTDGDDDENGFALWDEDDTDGGWAVTGRFTVIPWAKDTCHFVHLGASASYRNPNTVQYRARPGLGRGPRVVDTGVIAALDGEWLWNAEFALEWHALHATAEYTLVTLDAPALGDPTFSAWYVQAGLFLTGEARAYDFKKGSWGGTSPCCGFLQENCSCKGAVEVAARLERIDLNDAAATGGDLQVLWLGLNWYLNPYVRLMFDWAAASVKDRLGPAGTVIVDAGVNSFLMRWDIHF